MGCIGGVFKFIGLAVIGLVLLGIIGMYVNQGPTSSVQSSSKAKQMFGNEEEVSNKQNNSELHFTDKQSKLIRLILNYDISSYANNKASDNAYQIIIKDRNIVKVTANKLFNDYHLNELKADDLYRDKEIILTGIISSIDRSIGTNYYLSLSTNEMFYTVQAHFEEEYKSVLAELKKGQKYTMHCIGDGMLLQSPRLENCKPIQVWIDSEVESLFLALSKVSGGIIDNNKSISIKELSKYPKDIILSFLFFSGFILSLNDDSPLFDISNIDKKFWDITEVEMKKTRKYLDEILPQIEEQNLGVKDVIHLIKEHNSK